MTQSVLNEQTAEPGMDDFGGAVGTAEGLWDELIQRLGEMGAQGRCAWGGKKYGWELRFSRAGKPFTTLTPQDDAFVALVVLGRDQVDRLESLSLGPRTRRTFEEAPQLRDGRWLFLRVETRSDLTDVIALLTLKVPLRVRERIGAGAIPGPAEKPR